MIDICYYMRSEAISDYFRTLLSTIYHIPHAGYLQVYMFLFLFLLMLSLWFSEPYLLKTSE